MAKDNIRLKARLLRTEGVGIRSIASVLNVSKSSVSWWVRDIELSEIQRALLTESARKGGELGRFKSIQIRREKRERIKDHYLRTGIEAVAKLTDQELLFAGLALYWAEGTKSDRNRRIEFCNSDPEMIKFFLIWLEKCFCINKQDIRCVVGINEMHQQRDDIVRKYWSDITGIPDKQFRKTSFKRVVNKKLYDNFDNHYGTLYVLVTKSTNLYYQIMGLIKGLSQSTIKAG